MELNKEIDMFKNKVKCIKIKEIKVETKEKLDSLLDNNFITKYYKNK
jgi:hypothetical protein